MPGGNDAQADAATMLIRLRPRADGEIKPRKGQTDFGYGDYVAFSKICTHAGCPVSLYEQETSRILCPCHQSQFLVTEGAEPVFGPATRPLPQLPITVDEDGLLRRARAITMRPSAPPTGAGSGLMARTATAPGVPTTRPAARRPYERRRPARSSPGRCAGP